MPEGSQITLTHSLIDKCRANGAFTNATLNALGIEGPLRAGWVERLVGKTIPREAYREARTGKYIYRQKRSP